MRYDRGDAQLETAKDVGDERRRRRELRVRQRQPSIIGAKLTVRPRDVLDSHAYAVTS